MKAFRLLRFGLVFIIVATILVACSVTDLVPVLPQQPPAPKPNDDCVACTSAEAYSYYNSILTSAGLITNPKHPNLHTAAENHANYLFLNNSTGHGESPGLQGFTGNAPWDRTVAAGFQSTGSVTEGVSFGDKTPKEAIDGLMSAIYHRFGILRFDANSVGIGFKVKADKSGIAGFTHNPANSLLHDLCNSHTFSTGAYYFKVCADETKKIEVGAYDGANDAIKAQNPKFVIWPPNNGTDVWTSFCCETPDPMPGFTETGYPVSVQFNDYFYTTAPVINSFELFDASGAKVTATRLISKATDVNKKFDEFQFALFPLELLTPNSRYTTTAKFIINGSEEVISWSFMTGAGGR